MMTPEERAERVWRDLIAIRPEDAVTGDVMMAGITAAIREAVAAERERMVRAMCSRCGRGHVLDNGRVWIYCGTRRLMPALTEKEIAATIRARP